ncbi:SRPBCC family protein [Nannocystis pusilla]|uniref:SRPBCC family protein n=1 Tax=Nannocystis pusilla TaxID=889268 RepID=UPI003DA67CCA
MPIIELVTPIRAPIERCFDLSRSVELHLASTGETGERAVAGVVRGLLGPGDEVTWRARHFGVWQLLTSRITQFERPRRFRDSMVRGAFARFDHDHLFEADVDGTIMRDRFDFTSPLGPLGRLADALVLTRYMRCFLVERNRVLREIAESDRWREFLAEE